MKTNTSVTVTNNILFKAYCVKVIKVSELQQEVDVFVKTGGDIYAEILEFIQSDYCAQDTGKYTKDTITSTLTYIPCCNKTVKVSYLLECTTPALAKSP